MRSGVGWGGGGEGGGGERVGGVCSAMAPLLERDRIDRTDRAIAAVLLRAGHPLHRVTLGAFFIWLGLLKQFGLKTGSSLLAHTIWVGSPEFWVPALGWWEVAIGVALIVRPLNRLAILLLLIRLPGILLALVLKHDVCFDGSVFVPTLEGQYLIKDLMLFGAAMVIGGEVRGSEPHHEGASRAADPKVVVEAGGKGPAGR